jgi:hypothetical protein
VLLRAFARGGDVASCVIAIAEVAGLVLAASGLVDLAADADRCYDSPRARFSFDSGACH